MWPGTSDDKSVANGNKGCGRKEEEGGDCGDNEESNYGDEEDNDAEDCGDMDCGEVEESDNEEKRVEEKGCEEAEENSKGDLGEEKKAVCGANLYSIEEEDKVSYEASHVNSAFFSASPSLRGIHNYQ